MGSKNVYFQPPSDKRLSYPCIIYSLDYIKAGHANNFPYMHTKRYSVTYIDKLPDQYIPDKIMQLPMCSFDRAYVADNLNHTAYRLYFDAVPNNLNQGNNDEEETIIGGGEDNGDSEDILKELYGNTFGQ